MPLHRSVFVFASTVASLNPSQIRACLQSAIDKKDLQNTAFSAWMTLMRVLNGEDAVSLIDHTFAITVQHWHDLTPEVQQRTYDTIADMLKTHSNLIREAVITVPSLADIPLMSKFESEINRLKQHESKTSHLDAFVKRLREDNTSIVLQCLRELVTWLDESQSFVHEAAVSEPPGPVVLTITRALLDTCVKYNVERTDIAELCAKCLGIVGCLDPNRIDATANKQQLLVMSDFEKAAEVVDWVAVLLEEVLVRAFKSATSTRAQGFVGYVMQELLKFAGFNEIATIRLRPSQSSPTYQRWLEISENTRNALYPFLTSRYVLNSSLKLEPREYPIFSHSVSHRMWLRTWVNDMLWRAKGENPQRMFPVLARIIKGHDIAIANFILPYTALNIVLGGTTKEVEDVAQEMLVVLSTESVVQAERETLRQCSEVSTPCSTARLRLTCAQNVFVVLDYMSRWVQEKKRELAVLRVTAHRAGQSPSQFNESQDLARIDNVEGVIASIPADIIAQRAIECGSYARALFHWEHYIREQTSRAGNQTALNRDAMYQRLQTIYTQIDEPDGLEGISAKLNVLSPEQQAIQHRRAGQWSAAQSWYEIESAQKPDDVDLHLGLLNCLRESGQYGQSVVLN